MPSLADVAVTVTVFGAGTIAGAVYVVATPLAVVTELKFPHAELPHVTDQVTPPFWLSLFTTAAKLPLAPATSDIGGCGLNATVIAGGAAIAIVADADFVLSETDVAVIVTVADAGTAAGAVYVVAAPLAVVAVLKLPHCELPHVTDQLTPAFFVSLLTTAATLVAAPAVSEGAGLVPNATTIDGGGALIVIVADTLFVLSETDVAVMVSVPDAGAAAGAVYVVAAPLAVITGLKLPHCELPHVADQLTPPFLLSLVTTAVTLVLTLVICDEEGCGLNVTAMGFCTCVRPEDPPLALHPVNHIVNAAIPIANTHL